MAASSASISKIPTQKLRRVISSSVASSFRGKWVRLPDPSFSTSSASAVSSAPLPPVSSTLSSETQGSRWTKLLLFVPGAITFGLGTWQLFRREEKIRILEYRNKRLGLEPISGNNLVLSSDSLDTLEYRRVVCKGHFDENRSIYVGPRSRSISGVTENGYYLITPLMPIPNDPQSLHSPILVNRGWVPRSRRDSSLEVSEDNEQLSRIASSSAQDNEKSYWWRFWSKKPKVIEELAPPVTPVEVVGVVRGSENPSAFVPANDPSSHQWFYVDVPAIARECGFPENTIYTEYINDNVSPRSPYPIPKDSYALIRSSVMPQDHFNYALTWYSLSAAVTYMAFKRLTPRKIIG